MAKTPLAKQPLPDAYQKIDQYRNVKRNRGETAAEYVLREQKAYDKRMETLGKLRRGTVRCEKKAFDARNVLSDEGGSVVPNRLQTVRKI